MLSCSSPRTSSAAAYASLELPISVLARNQEWVINNAVDLRKRLYRKTAPGQQCSHRTCPLLYFDANV
jgi:hypothetical protein